MDALVSSFGAIVFYTLAAVAVAGAVGVIGLRNPVHAAMALLLTFLAVAGLFVLQHAELIAAVQVLVYAGGVMVLFLFVIMLVNVRVVPAQDAYLRRLVPAVAVVTAVLVALIGAGTWAAFRGPAGPLEPLVSVEGTVMGNTEAVGWSLYRDYLLPFEVVSVVLLVAMIGAIVMGRKGREEQA
jgi:NADH-quinone oxidoreductase subunit J